VAWHPVCRTDTAAAVERSIEFLAEKRNFKLTTQSYYLYVTCSSRKTA